MNEAATNPLWKENVTFLPSGWSQIKGIRDLKVFDRGSDRGTAGGGVAKSVVDKTIFPPQI